MNTDKELQRVLGNPDNVIMSESLEAVLSKQDQEVEISYQALIGNEGFICKVQKLEIKNKKYIFSLEIHAFSIEMLLENSQPIILRIADKEYRQILESSTVWKDNLLTITTRRIFNEAVQA